MEKWIDIKWHFEGLAKLKCTANTKDKNKFMKNWQKKKKSIKTIVS